MADPAASSSMPSTRTSTPQRPADTPPSSPPSEGSADKMEDSADKGVSETMRAEEEKMRQISERDEAKRQQRLDEEREKDLKGGPGAVDGKFKALEYLLSQSKVHGSARSSRAPD